MEKKWVRILLGVVGLLVIALALLPLFVNANTFRPTLQTQISNALGRQVTLGDLSFSIFSGSIVASNIAIADDPAFGAQPFLEAKSLKIGVEVAPLVFHKQLIVTRFAADAPIIRLVHGTNGVWNFSSIGRTAASHTQDRQKESSFPNLTVGEIRIQNGSASVSSMPSDGSVLVYSNLNLSAQEFSFSKSFPFQLSATLPGAGSVEVKGTAGPISQQDASDTPFSAKIDLKHFDPVVAGLIPASQGLSMLLDIAAQADSNGKAVTSNGTVRAVNLKLAGNGTPAPRPVDLSYTVTHNLDTRSGQLSNLDIQTGAVTTHINGTYQLNGQQVVLALHLSAQNLPIDQVEALLPAAGIRLPSGSSLQGGTLTANLNLTGPANALTISGPVQVSNTRLAGFDLGSKIGGLNPMGGSGGGTQIQVLRADVTNSPTGTAIRNLYTAVSAIGTATGAGTISPQGGLNFRILAKLSPGSGVVSSAAGGLAAASSAFGGALSGIAAKGIPLNITGTTSQPIIQADLSQVLKQNAGSLLQQQLGLGKKQSPAGGLFNKVLPR